MTPPIPLTERVRVVLVQTQHPGNIGSAARAMKTMGFTDLALVAPDSFPHPEADVLAVGADDVLKAARRFATLKEAVADCGYVIGSTARLRSMHHDTHTPRELAQRLTTSIGGRIALVFGSERTGLSNEDFELCHALVSIPANPEFRVLNLAAAVQILCYELRQGFAPALHKVPEHLPVPQREMEYFFEHLEKVLLEIGFLNPKHPKQLLRRMRVLFSRATPDENEMHILRGVLAAVQEKIKSRG